MSFRPRAVANCRQIFSELGGEKMKKLIVLVFIILLAKLPIGDWQTIPDKVEFLKLLGVVYLDNFDCKKCRIGVIEVEGFALFFGDCLDVKEVSL